MNAYKELLDTLQEINKTENDISNISILMEDENGKLYKIVNNITEINKLKSINYYDGYGCQELFGFIIFRDNSWLERYEYDGSERWEYKSVKIIKKFLKESKYEYLYRGEYEEEVRDE